jgi:hypothetical protein
MKAQFVYENINFERGGEPIKQMGIGQEALKKERVLAHHWSMTEDFLEQILSSGDFGYDEYFGFPILTYRAGSRYWSIIPPKYGSITKLSSSGGKASLTKESALKDLKAKIRRYLRDES